MSRQAWMPIGMIVVLAALSWIVALPASVRAQEAAKIQTPSPSIGRPAPENQAKKAPKARDVTGPLSGQDPYRLFCKSLFYSAKRGAHWLQSAQRQDDLFVYGWIPSLNRPLPDDNYLRQAGAAAALARAAAVTQEPELELAAQQAVVVLLTTCTQQDPDDPNRLQLTLAPADANPVGFAGLLLLAISELPNPSESLMNQGEQLARLLASRQRPDGSFDVGVSLKAGGHETPQSVNYYPGEALYGLLRSYSNRPEAWKIEVAKKAFAYYRRHFQENPSPAFVPWQSGAFAEVYLLTGESKYADFVFEMNDWILQFQYRDSKAAQLGWIGGFASYADGHILRTPPGASTGSFAEGLVDACRVAKMANDSRRMQTYRNAAESSFKFLMANQYSMAAHQHFQRWFSKKLTGAIHASVVDGTVRIDYTQHAINGMFHYLNHVAEYHNGAGSKPPATAIRAN